MVKTACSAYLENLAQLFQVDGLVLVLAEGVGELLEDSVQGSLARRIASREIKPEQKRSQKM